MLTEALVALALAGGTAVVEAMATDTWQLTRDRVARLFARNGKPNDTMIEMLDRDAERITAAEDEERERLKQELAPRWRQRLADLLDEDDEQDRANELKGLIAAVESTGSVQNISPSGHASAFGVMHGNMIIHQRGAPDSADGDAAD